MKNVLRVLAVAMLSMVPMADAKPPPDNTVLAGDVDMNTYILLDRTGSMSSIWVEALGSVNAYAAKVMDASDGEKVDARLTVAVFDAQDGLQFDVLRKGITAGGWKDISGDEASPRGMTPLFDAIGRTISLAEADAPEKAVIVIMTDGEENSSREMDRKGAQAALDRARARGWEVVFLGAEFANFSDAEAVGVAASQSMAVGSGQFSDSMARLATKSRQYGAGKGKVEFDAADREAAQEEDVKRRKGGQ
jgi:hypothetical protein